MTRVLRALVCLLPLLAAASARAQPPAPPAAPAMPITPLQARQALDVLNDPKKRAEMAAALEAIITAGPASPAPASAVEGPAKTAATPLGIPLAPDSLGAAVLVGAAAFLGRASDSVSEALHAAQGIPSLWAWLVTMATDPQARALLVDLAWRLGLALAGGLAALWGIGRALRRPQRSVARRLARLRPPVVPAEEAENGEARAERGEIEPPMWRRLARRRLLRRVPLVLARIALDLAPVLGFLVVGHVIAGSAVGGATLIRLVLLAVIDSYGLYVAALRFVRALLAPQHRRLRLLPVPDGTASYAMRWIRRLLVVGIFGYALAEVGLLLGLSPAAHLAVLKAVVLVMHVFIAVIVVQQRRLVRGWIRAPEGSQGVIARLRNGLASIWHWIALFYLLALWLVWAAAVPTGYQRLSRGLLAALAVALLARMTITAGAGALDRLLHRAADLAPRYPGIEARARFYHPFLLGFIRAVVYLIAVLLFLELAGLRAFEWAVASPLGVRITSSLSALVITLLVALGAWEMMNIAIERHLARLMREAQVARTARLRTLLPILRAGALIAIVTVSGLMVLSEIGVNTTPLLASAGIIGVAIGFGSQKLVQDLITGLFLLMENAMQVGDWVTVSGLSGTVEHLSVRTIRLRAADGAVHIIPFSAVTSVTNTNRGLGNAAVSVAVAYHEDTDRVCAVLRDIAAEMRLLPEFAATILNDLQLWGIDRVDGASATIAGQIACTDAGRWAVQREFNRRVKKRFEELGIEMFNPTRTLLVPVGRADAADTGQLGHQNDARGLVRDGLAQKNDMG